MSEARHLVTVWNPPYASDAMDEHLAVVFGRASRAGQSKIPHCPRAAYGVLEQRRAIGNCPRPNGYENGSNRID